MFDQIFEKVCLCRLFEQECLRLVEEKKIYIPYYSSLGEELPPAILTTVLPDWPLFPSHRNASWALCRGMDPKLILETFLNGKQGTASLASKQHNIYGHDGLLGSNIPISVGFADATKQPSICIAGDAAYEEDYALGAMGYAATHKVPILFIVMDNGLSILSPKERRRSWEITDVADSMRIDNFSYDIEDVCSRKLIAKLVEDFTSFFHHPAYLPTMINVGVHREKWHVGHGQDNVPQGVVFEKFKMWCYEHGVETNQIHHNTQHHIWNIFNKVLE